MKFLFRIVDFGEFSVESACKKNTIGAIGYCPYYTNSHKKLFLKDGSFAFHNLLKKDLAGAFDVR